MTYLNKNTLLQQCVQTAVSISTDLKIKKL
jgi:hypothetical protein